MININKCGTISSREVADMMKIRHSDLLRKINEINKDFKKNKITQYEFWMEGTYVDLRGAKRKEYQISLKGIQTIIDRTTNTLKNKKLIEFYNLHSSKKIILIDRLETSFLEKLQNFMNGIGIKIELQKQCLNGSYRIDAYIEKYNLAIEYDGEFHQQMRNKKRDIERQTDIEKALKCKFIRVNSQNTDEYNIGLIMKEIL